MVEPYRLCLYGVWCVRHVDQHRLLEVLAMRFDVGTGSRTGDVVARRDGRPLAPVASAPFAAGRALSGFC